MTAFDTLERQLHDAAATRRRRRRGPALAVVAVAAAAIAALLIIDGPGPVVEKEVTAPAPTVAAADPDQIVYVRATSIHFMNQDGKQRRSTTVTEEWHRGRETHRLVVATEPDGSKVSLDHVISADGVMRQINEEGEYRVIRPADNEDAAKVIAREQAGFLADFQRQVQRGELDPATDLEFSGRPARRYHVKPERTENSPALSFFVDRETGEPLGYTSAVPLQGANGPSFEFIEVVRTIRYLEPTPANLAHLREFTLKRR